MVRHCHFVPPKFCPDRYILLLIVALWRRGVGVLDREVEKTLLGGRKGGGERESGRDRLQYHNIKGKTDK